MPTWLTPVLKWGGIAVAVLSALALIYVGLAAPAPGRAPVTLYWILLVVGVVAAIIGFALERRRGPT